MQTFLSKLIDANGIMVNFERWNYKNLNTVIKNLKILLDTPFYQYGAEKSKKIVIYKTDYSGTPESKVFEQDIKEFLSEV